MISAIYTGGGYLRACVAIAIPVIRGGMNDTCRKIALVFGRCVALLVGLVLLAVPTVSAAAERDEARLHGRAVIRTFGAATTPSDEFDDFSLGSLEVSSPASAIGRLTKPVVRHPDNTTNAFTRDCALAEKGDAGAAFRLGRRYLLGLGAPRDKRMGIAWMRAAASRGLPAAAQVATMVPRNLGRMRPWCRSNLSPLRQPAPPPAEILQMVQEMAPGFGLDPKLVLAVIEVESAYHTNALSPKEAAGLMQLIPATAERFGVQNAFDPKDNLRGGMKYLRWLLAYFEGNVSLALAGYNAGEHAVDRYGGIPPYAETQAYVRLIHQLYPSVTHRFDAGAATPSQRFARQTADAGR